MYNMIYCICKEKEKKEMKEIKDMKETEKIIDEIKKNDLSAVEIENIFSALCNQKNFVGGKI